MKLQPTILITIALIFVVVRIIPLINNNFFFTADQGRDAVYVREILTNHRLFLLGPETTVRGIFTLPLWYYFIAIGYFFTNGHPAGGTLVLIILNLLVALYLVKFFHRPLLLLALAFYWGYYQASRFAFNPFPLVPLSILLVIFSQEFLSQKRHLWSILLIVFIAANTQLIGALIFAIYTILVVTLKIKKISFSADTGFILLTALLSLITYAVLLISPIHRDWYSVFLPPLIYISILLVIFRFPKKIKYLFFVVIFAINFYYFFTQYSFYLSKSPDRSILNNQLEAIDWVYNQAGGQGFDVYTYTDSFYDYTYQYLFWWYGLKKYGYLPQEYSNFPSAGKQYIPGNYSKPYKETGSQVFLISDSSTNGNDNKNWIDTYRSVTTLSGQSDIGQIHLEKRLRESPYYEFFNQKIIYRQYLDYDLTVKIPEYWQSARQLNRLTFTNPSQTITVTAQKISPRCPALPTTPGVIYVRKSGPKNDFLLTIKPFGIMVQADGLISIITDSFKMVEDNNASSVYNCD